MSENHFDDALNKYHQARKNYEEAKQHLDHMRYNVMVEGYAEIHRQMRTSREEEKE